MRHLVAIALLAVVAGAQDSDVDAAIADIAAGRNVAAARGVLESADRTSVEKKLREAVDDETLGIASKARLLGLLDPQSVPRMLDAKSLSTQRAACSLLWGDAELKARCGEIALAWLKDEAAEDRGTAATICGRLGLADAQPLLLDIVSRDPKTEGERDLFQHALNAIPDPKPPQLINRLLKLASDSRMDTDVRGVALLALESAKNGPRDQILTLAIAILSDRGADRILRMRAALGLREFPEDRACEALKAVLLSDEEDDRILQRNCLYALGEMRPADDAVARRYLERLRQLLVDRRVYRNPYFAMKVDVATALSALNARDPATFDIMCEYLLDEDKDDKQHLVRQEAWLTLWTLTATKLVQPFDKPPQPFDDPLTAREFLFRRSFHRPGITQEQGRLVAQMADDLEKMRTTQKTYESLRAQILEQWDKEATKEKAPGTPPPKPPDVGPENR